MPDPQSSQSGTNPTSAPTPDPTAQPDPTAPAGSPTSVGAQSIRDGRPSTCDDVVEALDEAGPGPK